MISPMANIDASPTLLVGRRSLLLATFPNMAWTLLAVGMMFFIPDTEGNQALKTGLIAL
jgi:hypothetical protein